MRKSRLKDGNPFFGIKIEHFVKANDFAKHLAEYFHNKDLEFDSILTKTEAMDILKRGLFFNGLDGEIDETQYEGAGEEALGTYCAAYPLALDWVHKNYPYLIP